MTKQKLQKRDAAAALRAAQAVKLRAQRLTYREIALQCGYADASTAYNAVQRELERTMIDTADDYRQQELDMLNRLHAAIWSRAVGDHVIDDEDEDGKKNKGPSLWAIDRLLSISEARRKLLGLDAKGDNPQAAQTFIREYGVDVGAV